MMQIWSYERWLWGRVGVAGEYAGVTSPNFRTFLRGTLAYDAGVTPGNSKHICEPDTVCKIFFFLE